MSGYRYAQARRVGDRSVSASPEPKPAPPIYGATLSSEPETNDYSDRPYDPHDPNMTSNAMFYDPNSPFFGIDPQLVGFVQKHNVVMDDGAVVNINAMKEKAAMESKPKTKFHPPFGLSRKKFVVAVVITAVIIVLALGLSLGLYFGLLQVKPSYPQAQPWWRRTLMYQINVATWANDVGGPTGRLADVIPRMAYLSVQVGATSAVITNLISSDTNGVLEWTQVSSQVAAPDKAITTLLPQLASQAKKPGGSFANDKPIQLILGLPLYGTSIRHAWFEQSRLATMSKYSSFYWWTTQAPATAQEQRYYAYDPIRKAYYRHSHGNPNSPLLNLSNADVQNELKGVIQFWVKNLDIQGVVITNSTNVVSEMMSGMRTILDSFASDQFVWFADIPSIDEILNPRQKVCLHEIRINRHVPTRTDDLVAQITQAMNGTKTLLCSPIWQVRLLLDDAKDFETVQRLAYFLPGSFFMVAGQEVDLVTGTTELMQWGSGKYTSYGTYWPKNSNLPQEGLTRLQSWKTYWQAASNLGMLSTAVSTNRLVIIQGRQSEDLLALYREFSVSGDRVYFVVSFQTLNTMASFTPIFEDLKSPSVEVAYDTKNMYSGRRKFGTNLLVNNEVLLLYYY
ncbi:Trehalose-6-phosphate hydrolase [Fasciolopsis buskii]|uniref:Trehalose-6-phosphate hydrolase n=1 Tax=Fasciolopsis buskii TaxID=27845 RepID=A0A8E0S454_9TREM|nr:Trehalose-6-phosphate hydrolase [Fasciolopsis buski]